MKKLFRIELIATDLIKYFCPSFRFQWDKSVERYGLCRYSKKVISISKPLAELNNEEITINTILHEIAHAKAGRGTGHSRIWKDIAVSIGCTGKITYDSSVVQPKSKYVGKCPNCSTVITGYRRRRVSCGKCSNGVFNLKYLIVWVKQ